MALLAAGAAPPLQAYEADVHHGLTLWLATQAGFAPWQALAIASGNARVDSGLMSTIDTVLDYACVARSEPVARRIQQRHYPADAAVPAARELRAVVPGGPAARRQVARTIAEAKGKEGQYLGLLGAALHPLQDSWAHEGIPSAPASAFGCDPHLAGHPATATGPNPHAADHTATFPASTLAMAQATYEALTNFAAVGDAPRTARPWADMIAPVKAFAQARTRTAKHDWFMGQGITDTGFLAATTLPDGPAPGPWRYEGRQLPPLPAGRSLQHDAPADVRIFFHRLLSRWLAAEPPEKLLAEFGRKPGGSTASGRGDAAQLAARLTLWRLKDHGASAHLAHLARPLDRKELMQVERLAKRPDASVSGVPEQALLPLTALGPNPSALLPYVVRKLPATPRAPDRMIAITRPRHTPYDTLAWVAEQSGTGWVLVDVTGVTDQ
ncbi:MAG TPA: hypothetical protein VLK85_19315 [Ramlibacter sp.]|nr:hypothetical protein [Ramlibacter sp.]